MTAPTRLSQVQATIFLTSSPDSPSTSPGALADRTTQDIGVTLVAPRVDRNGRYQRDEASTCALQLEYRVLGCEVFFEPWTVPLTRMRGFKRKRMA